MSYERDEAMRQQESTEAMIRMRDQRGSGAHPDPMRDHRMEPDTMGDNDDDHVHHSIAISLKRIADALHGDDQNTGMKHALAEIAARAFHGWGPSS
jgi:hypothetical protein